MNKKYVFAIALLVVVAALAAYRHQIQRAAPPSVTTPQSATYQCPMHPQETSDHPRRCSICGMKLESARPKGGTP